jgi:hypothetical protein
MRINHVDLSSARAISLAELCELLPECGFLRRFHNGQRDPGCTSSRNQWEELIAPYWPDTVEPEPETLP